MKIAFYGNVCNNFYGICKVLKNYSSEISPYLYLSQNADLQNLPESEDPELLNNYPSWIKKDIKWDPLRLFTKFDSSFVKELSKYDLVVLSGRAISMSPFIKTKTIFFVTGGDLTLSPFTSRQFEFNESFARKINKVIASFFQRRGIRNASQIWTQPFFPFVNALNKLKIKNNKISNSYFPIPIDDINIKKTLTKPEAISDIDYEKIRNFKFIIFHPSRFMMNKSKVLYETGQWKNNGLLFYAFKEFLTINNIKDACIVLIKRSFSVDYPKAITLIKELHLEENIIWLNPKDEEGFTKNELLFLYSIANVTVDDFGVGWFGSIVLESLSCSTPVISFVDEVVMQQLYPYHPILSSNIKEDVASFFKLLYNDPTKNSEIGLASRKWLVDFHGKVNVGKSYFHEITKLLKSETNF